MRGRPDELPGEVDRRAPGRPALSEERKGAAALRMLRVLSPREPGGAEGVAAEVACGRRDLEENFAAAVEDAKANVSARTAVARDCPRLRPFGACSCGRHRSSENDNDGRESDGEHDVCTKQTSLHALPPSAALLDALAPSPSSSAGPSHLGQHPSSARMRKGNRRRALSADSVEATTGWGFILPG
jgi:hypothetical protein